MFNFLKKNHAKTKTPGASILDDERFRPRHGAGDTNKGNIGTENRVSYIRIPYSKSGRLALILSFISIALSYLAVRLTVYLKGNPELYVSAIVFSAIVYAFYSLYYVYRGFMERQVKYLINYIALLISGTELVLWLIILIMGGR